MRYLPLMFTSLLLLASCRKEKRINPVFVQENEEVGATDSVRPLLDMDNIVRTGTIIAGTLSGPDTYYEYRGQEFGLQLRMAQDFARSIGVKLRIEIAPDTAKLFRMLNQGDVDFIALNMPQWTTRDSSPQLKEAIQRWWNPTHIEQLAQAINSQVQTTKRHARPYMLNRQRGIISQWDALFVRYSHSANMDWRLIAALTYQESAFDPKAHSWAGAQGLMQLMPSTAAALGIDTNNLYDPETNVEGGCRYLGMQLAAFNDVPDAAERIKFALAAYNGGRHHVRDAMALAKAEGANPYRWNDVSTFILRLTDPVWYRRPEVKYGYMRGTETANYVSQIMERWQTYISMARSKHPHKKS